MEFLSPAVVTVCHLGYGKCSKISNTFLFLFSNNMFVFRTAVHKMVIRIANTVCLGLFWQSTSDFNFRTFTTFSEIDYKTNRTIFCGILKDWTGHLGCNSLNAMNTIFTSL